MTTPGTVLVTGATGFVGQRLVRRLAESPWRVIAATRNVPDLLHSNATARRIAPLERMSVADWRPVLEGVSHIVHLAGIAHIGASVSDALYDAVNHRATGVLAEAALAAGVRRMVFISSSRALAGAASTEVLTDASMPQPDDAYGRSKLAAENALEASGIEHVVLRPVLIVGPDARGNVADIIRVARSGLPLPLAGLNGRRSVVSLEDVVRAIQWALESPAAAGGRFLLADAEPMTLPEMFREVRRGAGWAERLFPLPNALFRLGLGMLGQQALWQKIGCDLVADSSGIRERGFTFRHPAREALRAAGRPAASPA